MILQLGYIALSLLMTVIISIIGIHAINKTFADRSTAIKKQFLLLSGLLLWQLYIFTIASRGLLQNFEFPPRFVTFLIFPAFLFTGIFIFINRKNRWLQNIPPHWLIYYQSFRLLIESLFLFTVAQGIITPIVTIEGYNYDMVFAFTAPIVAYLSFRKQRLPIKFVLYWNYFGLAVIAFIIFLFQSAIYLPELYGSETSLMPAAFATYPYVLVAGFLMPSAVFMHILSIVQLTFLKRENSLSGFHTRSTLLKK